jgi:lipid II:glycine glycyltransferase (peptidoglycan interpeptide bridge formation enzyme)
MCPTVAGPHDSPMFMKAEFPGAAIVSAASPSGQAGLEPGRLRVRRIDPDQHADFARAHSASFLQTPDWAAVKPGWQAESLGWFQTTSQDGEDSQDGEPGERLVGVALVLYRQVPHSRRSLAYVPEGPTLPWTTVAAAPAAWLDPFVAHLHSRRAFAVRIGPTLPVRRWQASTLKRGLADPQVRRFADLPPDGVDAEAGRLISGLRGLGWRPADGDSAGGFGAGQPRLGLRLDLRERTVAELLAGANQQWRRNVTRAVRAGVVVREGNIDDLPAFHRLYLETAGRDGFTPRPAGYFQGMWQALATGVEPALRLYLAEFGAEREPLAAALTIQVGQHCWYAYGASTSRHREAQASTALQWRAICDAQARGCHTYDMRGIADTLDQGESLTGLLRFKVGTGGACVETLGEWELSLSPLWHEAFRLYLRLRS